MSGIPSIVFLKDFNNPFLQTLPIKCTVVDAHSSCYFSLTALFEQQSPHLQGPAEVLASWRSGFGRVKGSQKIK
eukprot:5391190-Amphidinium_carterae.1